MVEAGHAAYCYCKRGSLLRCDNWRIDLDEHIHNYIVESINQ